MAGINLRPQYDEIMSSELPEIEKVSRAFNYLIKEHIQISQREIELLKAMGENEALVKEQIKRNTMEYTLSVFHDCFTGATGRKVSNE
jgi:hypothetical protein